MTDSEFTNRQLPDELNGLAELAVDLRVAGSRTASRIWRRLDAEAFERCGNPHMILQNVGEQSLGEAAADERFVAELRCWREWYERYLDAPGWFAEKYGESELKGVAYFSAEFGLSEALPVYSGESGILAGDHLKSASDLNVPLFGIGLLYQRGSFHQIVADDGWQVEAFPVNDPGCLPVAPLLDTDGHPLRVTLELPGGTLLLRAWQARVGKVNLYLLDSNHPLNSAVDRSITAELFASNAEMRLLQRLVLGVGGWRLLEKLGIDIQVCHLNEAHAAFAVLARAVSFAEKHNIPLQVALRATRAGNVLTTHTAVADGFEQVETTLLLRLAQPFLRKTGLSAEELLAMGRRDPLDEYEPFNMAYLAVRGCCRASGVSRLHGRVSRGLLHGLFQGWPQAEVPIEHITGGVHIPSWVSPPADKLWSQACPGDGCWLENLDEASQSIETVSDETLWDFRARARETLIHYVRGRLRRRLQDQGAADKAIKRIGGVLDPGFLTFGFACRFAESKRPNLLLHDPDRFAAILCNEDRPAQIIVAGKANPDDDTGKAMLQQIVWFSQREDVRDRVVFLEDYDMAAAQYLAGGIDVWISNSRRSSEACGIDSMRMLASGGLHASTLDGWWDEARAASAGWRIGGDWEHSGEYDADDAGALYDVLEEQVVPEFYDRDENGIPHGWVDRIRASMSTLTRQFNSDRMVREYVERAYLPAADSFLRRGADGAELAFELEAWHTRLCGSWHHLRFGEVRCHGADEQWHFEVDVYFGDLDPAAVQVQLFADATSDGEPIREPMIRRRPIDGVVHGFVYQMSVAADRPANHFTPRVVPYHAQSFVPLEASQSLWYGQ